MKASSNCRVVCSFVNRFRRKLALPPRSSSFVERGGLMLAGGALEISAASNRVAPCGSPSYWLCMKRLA